MRLTITIPLAFVALAACGPRVAAPSLAPRPVERQTVPFPDEAAEPATAAGAALVRQLAAILDQAEQAHRRFAAEQARAGGGRRAAGAAEGSEAWIAAQQAASALEAARGDVRAAASSIDALRIDPAYTGTGDRAAIDAAAAQVNRLIAAEGDAG